MKQLETPRLLLTPMTDEELAETLAAEADREMEQAYGEMLEGCIHEPQDRLWYTAWRIALREDGTLIGDLCFKGPPVNGEVELGYGILREHQGRGYATEAAGAAAAWAFTNSGVRFVMAETEAGNAASRRVLEKLGFLPSGMGEEGPRFRLAPSAMGSGSPRR